MVLAYFVITAQLVLIAFLASKLTVTPSPRELGLSPAWAPSPAPGVAVEESRTTHVEVPKGEDAVDYVRWFEENKAWFDAEPMDPRIDPDWLNR